MLPEILESAAEFGAAQSDDGIGSAERPVHASALEPGSNGDFAAGLDDTGGCTEAQESKAGVSHSMAVPDDVVKALSYFVRPVYLTAKSADQVNEPPLIQFLMT